MALQYGMNILASDMKNILEKNDRQRSGIRTWNQLFGNASLGYQAQSDALRTNYADVIAQAYKANLNQQNAILGAGLSAGSTSDLLAANRQNLHNTYREYVQGFDTDQNTVNEGYNAELNAITGALNERAQNLSRLYGSAYDYLSSELAGATMSRDLVDKPIYDEDEVFQGYEQEQLRYLDESGMNWLKDENGDLLSWNAISNQLLNPDGTLNKKGTEFFDQMFNATPQGYLNEEGEKIKGFDEWLAERSADEKDELYGLRDWAIGQDAYNFNKAGTNLGTANIITGRESTDTKTGAYDYIDINDANKIRNNVSGTAGTSQKIHNELLNLKKLRNDPLLPADDRATVRQRISVLSEQNKEAWSNYQQDVVQQKSDLLLQLKQTVGSDLYNEFLADEAGFENEYQSLLSDMKSKNGYDETSVTSMNKWYENFVKRIQSFIKSHAYTGKTSGY